MRIHAALGFFAFVVLGRPQDMPSTAPASVSVPSGGATVPMLDIGGRPMVSLTIDGKGPFRFILDTGASFTGIDDDLATELSLPAAGAPFPPDAVRAGEVRIDGFVAKGFLAQKMASMLRGLGDNVPRGVLSAEAFPGYLVVIDYPGKRVTFTAGALPAADNRRIFEYASTEELPVIPVRVAGHEYRIHLDTGSPTGVMLPLKYIPDLPLESAPFQVGQARTVAGTFPVSRATVNGPIEIGEFTIEERQIEFSDLRPGPLPGIGNIGARVLGSFVVTIDAKNRRVKLER